jgi:SAM-dependent methyltransferase
MSEWFGTWFDSEYYHLLYKDRDYTEAEAFVAKLAAYLEPPKDALIHDLACGKGRHSIYLNKLGYHVEGSDYSANSIKHAKQHENDTLKFYVHDMRLPMPRKYDYILNLFTSFGYFNTEAEHLSTLKNIYNGLKENGTFLFDFMNVDHVLAQLVHAETITKGHIEFDIKRALVNGKITKHITFLDKRIPYHYTEEVAALRYDEIIQMMTEVGFQIVDSFGSYQLTPFDKIESKRLILMLKK